MPFIKDFAVGAYNATLGSITIVGPMIKKNPEMGWAPRLHHAGMQAAMTFAGTLAMITIPLCEMENGDFKININQDTFDDYWRKAGIMALAMSISMIAFESTVSAGQGIYNLACGKGEEGSDDEKKSLVERLSP